jgi:glycosyltransferase involved in cell wall biosynthesis
LIAGASEKSTDGGMTRAELEHMAEQHDCQESLIIREGYVPDNLVPRYFQASDIVSVLYRQDYDVSGPLLIACKYGIPVLATNRGDIGALVREWRIGCAVDMSSAASVAAGIDQLLDWAPSERKRAADAANGLLIEYSWEKVAQRFLALYQMLLENAH